MGVLDKPIFKNGHLESFSKGLSEGMTTYTCNSATGILALFHAINACFYEIDIKSMTQIIKDNLHKDKNDFLDSLHMQNSTDFSNLYAERHTSLSYEFFNYYWARLPVLLKCNSVDGRIPNTEEREEIYKDCGNVWIMEYPDFDWNTLFRDFNKFQKLTRSGLINSSGAR